MGEKPVLSVHKTRPNSPYFLFTFITSLGLFAFSVLYSTHGPHTSRRKTKVTAIEGLRTTGATGSDTSLENILQLSSTVESRPLSVILPVSSSTLPSLQALLAPLMGLPTEDVHEIIIGCPEAIASDARRALQQTYTALGPTAARLDVSLRPWQGYLSGDTGALRTAISISKEAEAEAVNAKEGNFSVLVLGEKGLGGVSAAMASVLLHNDLRPALAIPFGPRGSVIDGVAPVSFLTGRAWAASRLTPPFVIPSSVLARMPDDSNDVSWDHSLKNVSYAGLAQLAGLVLEIGPDTKMFEADAVIASGTSNASAAVVPSFVFPLPTRNDLHRLVPLVCGLKERHPEGSLRILVYAEETLAGTGDWETEHLETDRCGIDFQVLQLAESGTTLFAEWLGDRHLDIVISLTEHDYLSALLEATISSLSNASVIKIPRSDLDSTEWMSSLSLTEWKNWHIPQVEISIITKDRPQSLRRLLASLGNARYFGDSLDIRVNVEQDCDLETLRIVQGMSWPLGHVVVHRRVIHAGLLTAVVESWYPSSNDTYGVLLEDDIELSPLFYAWIKMTLLRYRYGDEANKDAHMFGISLYQQKHLELPMRGRQPFNPRTLLATEDVPHPTTPYLSQVPCSWGAVYFPEHWREFNDYLAARFAELVLPIGDTVVPNVRSNQWSKSWKKFFIELVYLRGYVMLYPNYEGFLSLSTNHLEVGSHVKRRSAEKEELFVLPLMELQTPSGSGQLLEMPGRRLPELKDLPVLNLTGSVVTMDVIKEEGVWRRSGILGCDSATALYDIRSLLCIVEDL